MTLVNNRKKIIVAVHNTIISDARVRKCAMTLQRNGFDLKLIGLDETHQECEIDGIPMKLVGRSPLLRLYKFVSRTIQSLNKLQLALSSSALLLFFAIIGFYLAKYFELLPLFWSLIAVALVLGVAVIVSKRKMKDALYYVRERYALPIGYHLVARQMAKEMKRCDGAGVVHAHDIIALIAALEAKKAKPDMVIIWDAHEIYAELSYKSKYANAFVDETIRKSAKQVDFFITINDSIAAYYADRYANLPQASIVMNATWRSDGMIENNTKLRDAANIAYDQKVLLFQGGLGFGRGIDVLLEAAHDLPEDWSIVFMGNGEKGVDIARAAETANMARSEKRPAISTIPSAPYSELAKWTSGATLGAIPYENTSLNHFFCTPNKLWEYPNAGVPILATALPEMARLIEHHKTGILLPIEFSASDITSALSNLTEKKLETLQKNAAAFNAVENWERYEPALLNVHGDGQML